MPTPPIRTAVIPCAGAGTRMRPATRAVPKPLLPVIDKPVIQYVVEEAVAAGIERVVLVVDERPGNPVVTHFVGPPALEGMEDVEFVAVEQPEPAGLGDAVLHARDAVGDEAFLCMVSDRFPVPGRWFADRMVAAFEGRPVVAVERVGQDLGDRYGFVSIAEPAANGVMEVTGAVEKPGVGKAPSEFALLGRYVFGPEIFEDLGSLPLGYGDEIQLTDAIDGMARRSGAVGLLVDHVLLDIGLPAGLLEATAAVGLARPDLAPQFISAMRRMLDG